MLEPLLKLEEWGDLVSSKIQDGSAHPTYQTRTGRGPVSPTQGFHCPRTSQPWGHSSPALLGACRNLGDSQHRGAGSAQGLGLDWLSPGPDPVPAGAAALSLPQAADQQHCLGHRAVIRGDTGLGWHLWQGKQPRARLHFPVTFWGHMAMHTEEECPTLAAAPKAEPWPQLPMVQLLVPSKVPLLSPPPCATAQLHCQCLDMTPETCRSCREEVATVQEFPLATLPWAPADQPSCRAWSPLGRGTQGVGVGSLTPALLRTSHSLCPRSALPGPSASGAALPGNCYLLSFFGLL